MVKSMKEGGLFLMDEISLAEDSVLERMNRFFFFFFLFISLLKNNFSLPFIII